MIPQQFKDQVARKYGYKDWECLEEKSLPIKIQGYLEEAALLYAQSNVAPLEERISELEKELSDTKANLHRAYKGLDESEQRKTIKGLQSAKLTLKNKLERYLQSLIKVQEIANAKSTPFEVSRQIHEVLPDISSITQPEFKP